MTAFPSNQFLIKVPLLFATGSYAASVLYRVFLRLTFIVSDFVISTFFPLSFLFKHLGVDRREFLAVLQGAASKTHLFCTVVLLHPSLQIKTLSFCAIVRMLGQGVPLCNGV